ncbi:7-cyano-7-deazaguanine synthase [Candidatus Woesearchaeota archaeon]|nr:7-cyano-7-deazaguanine synthase [Candidatus Woesearchaeota archaeon]
MKGLLLLSGGFDSPVAASLLQKKGVEVIAAHFSYEPFTDDGPEQKARKLCEQLNIKKLIVVKAGESFADIARKCSHRFYYILGKRFMLRYSEKIAKQENCSFLITGDNLAQVSSQTLPNLTVIDQAASFQVIRPLLCYDKKEILKIAREIGTYDLSIGPEVCDCLGPKYPATQSILKVILDEEKKLNMEELMNKATSLEPAIVF